MFTQLLLLEWKSFCRSTSLKQDVAIKVLLTIVFLYMASSLYTVGASLYENIQRMTPGKTPMELVNKLFIVWLFAELLMRLMLQSLPIVQIKPLLILPIKRKTIIHFVLLKSIFSPLNLLWAFVFIPFGISVIKHGDYALGNVFSWWLAVLGFILTISFLNFWISKSLLANAKVLLLSLVGVLLLAILDYFQLFQITTLFAGVMNSVLQQPVLLLVPIVLLVGLYFINLKNLLRHLSIEMFTDMGTGKVSTALDWSWIKRLGTIAPFLMLDIRMIMRNKRAKNLLWTSLFFSLYGLLFLKPSQEINHMIPFISIFMTGVFMINFGQFIPAWDSAYYAMLMSQNLSVQRYLEAKATLMLFSIVIMSILTTPYVYFGWYILGLNLAGALYNAGVNVPLILYIGSFNKKRVDLDKSAMFNYQGTGAVQWVMALPILILPVFIWAITKALTNDVVALAVLAGFGLLGLLLKKYILVKIAALYKAKKFVMLTGFKEQN